MPRFKLKGVLERSAASDLWKHTLSHIPTTLGRLIYLASLRDQNSGVYRHHGLANVFGRDESVKALRESHEQTFLECLSFNLMEKHGDLARHFAELEEPGPAVAAHWLDSGFYRTLVPAAARELERDLFCRDLEALLQLIRNAPGASFPRS